MINTSKITPSYYSKESRDFQLLGSLFDAVFNYSKMSANDMINFPLTKNIDIRFLDLVAKTLGFESKHKYNSNSLLALVNSFKKIMYYKGTMLAVEECVNMLLNSQNINSTFYIDEVSEPYKIKIYVPTTLVDIILLEDMIAYVLPAGFVYEIYSRDLGKTTIGHKVQVIDTKQHITGTSRQLSRVQSYINTSLIVGAPAKKDEEDENKTDSGKDYIEKQKEKL